jgi:collagen type VII alpha
MSFRRFGGLQYAAKHNIVSSNYNTANYLSVTDYVGQPNSYINFLSDISGNILGLNVSGNSVPGQTGPAGIGYTGPAGIGYTGPAGIGYTGPAGIGYTGPAGISYTGPAGISYTGPAGISYTGPAGISYTGPAGISYTGPAGISYTGPAGISYTGPAGISYTGPQGPQGLPVYGTLTNYGVNWSKTGPDSNWAAVAISENGQYQSAVSSGSQTGLIYLSSNYGVNWSQVFSTTNDWQSISMSSSGQYQTALAYGGGIYISNNYGFSWNLISGTINTWKSISISSSGQYQTAVSSGTSGIIYISQNYGVSWNQVNSISGDWIAVSLSSTGQYQTSLTNGSNGQIYISNNYGVSWSTIPDLTNDWQSISMSLNGQYQTICVQYSNYIYTSNNYGVSWVPILVTNIYSNFYSVSISGNGQYQTTCVNGVGGLIYISTNYGLTWTSIPNMSGNWTSVAVSTNGQYQIASNSGYAIYISITNNNGLAGATGPAGSNTGLTGPVGATGSAGATGAPGAPGINGINGTNGTNGTNGATGPMGDSYWSLTNNVLSPVNSYTISGSDGIFNNLVVTSNNTWETNGLTIKNTSATDSSGNPASFQFLVGGSGNGSGAAGIGGFGIYSSYLASNNINGGFAFNINSNGYVGIGTTNPSSSCQINGSTDYSGLTQNPMPSGLTIGTTTGSEQLLFGAYYTGGVGSACAIQSVDYYSNLDHTQPLLLNPQGGNVGIGTTNPSTALQVNGTVTASSFNSLSDYRIKEKIIQLDNKFSIDSLKPVSYFNKESKKNDIGLIAHELQEVYPELVTGEKDGINLQTINYTGLIPILIKEIQELKSRVKELELKNKI